ncbi:MAG: hypothetical protein SFV19_06620 [Rhodospirillaceae bacterium]|nr:hypothetical protein [Rhodospirillaceae bacterium]
MTNAAASGAAVPAIASSIPEAAQNAARSESGAEESKGPLSFAQAKAILAERRAARAEAESADEPAPNTQAEPGQEPAVGEKPAQPQSETEPAPPQNNQPMIDIDGVKLTADEIKQGYMRTADYTRKTQELSERARAVSQEREMKLARLAELVEGLAAEQIAEPDWVEVARADPRNWVQKKALWDSRRTAVESAQRILAAERADALDRARAQMVAELRATYNPAWREPQVLQRDFAQLAAYARAQGFTDEEVESISSAHHIRTLDKARKWDELQRQRPIAAKRLSAKPNVQRPGAKADQVAAHQRQLQSAWERFLKSPSVENGVAYSRAKRDASTFRRNADGV